LVSAADPEPEPAIVAAVGTFGVQGMVHIPDPLLRSTGWSREGNLPLVIQWIEPGRLRLHLESDVLEQLETYRTKFEHSDAEDAAAFIDMYRPAKLYLIKAARGTKYGVRLEAETASHLAIAMDGDRTIYLEARRAMIDIMSPNCRNKRLQNYVGEILL